MTKKTDQSRPVVKLRNLERISSVMDSSIRLPGGYRIGWDGIIGLIPGIGDLVGMGVSLYIMAGAMRLGASRMTMLRMLGNVALESTVGAIPVFGDLFDLAFKANSRNMKILNRQLENPVATEAQSSIRVLLWSTAAIVIILLISWLVFSIVFRLLSWIF